MTVKQSAAIKATGFVLWELVEFLFILYIAVLVFIGQVDWEQVLANYMASRIGISLMVGAMVIWIVGAWIDKFTEYLENGSDRTEA